jgi:hypothetical protein
MPRTAASHALHEGLETLGGSRLMAQTRAAQGAAGGGAVPDAGDPESPRRLDDAVARGVVPGPKGSKPVAGSEPETDGGARDSDPSTDGTSGGTDRPDRAPRGPEARQRHHGFRPAPTGPATPEDAWKWEGVPPGRSLIGKVEPGKMRYYMGDNNGPCIKWLPPAWPPGERDADG